MPQIDTVWDDVTNDELHVIVDGDDVQIRSADNGGLSRARWFKTSEYPELSNNILVFQRGSDLEFIPNVCTGTSGEIYDGIRVNNQIWLSTGLRATMFNDGTAIESDYQLATTPKRYYYYSPTDTPLTHDDSYGMLYNYYVVTESNNHGGVAPSGWNISSWVDWDTLMTYLKSNPAFSADPGNPDVFNYIMKSIASKDGWISYNTSGSIGNRPYLNNATGLNLYPWGTKTGDNARQHYGNRCHIWIVQDTGIEYDRNSINISYTNIAGIIESPTQDNTRNGKFIFCVKNLSSPVTLMMSGFGNSNPNNSTDGSSENLEDVEPDEDISEENIDNAADIEENESNEQESENSEIDEMR